MLDNRAIVPIQFFHDLAGDALDGGTVYFGEDGRDPEAFPQAVYWDRDLTISAGASITTLAGRPSREGAPATVFAAGGYSMRVKQSTGETVYTVLSVLDTVSLFLASWSVIDAYPNTVSPGTTIVNVQTGERYTVAASGGDLTTTSGINLIYSFRLYDDVAEMVASNEPLRGEGSTWRAGGFQYTEAAAGASDQDLTTAAGVKLYVKPIGGAVYFEQFGAAGDGTTDDSTALLAAIEYCRTETKTLRISSKTFLHSSTLTFPRAPSITVIGESMERSILKYTGAGPAVQFDASTVNVVDRMEMANFYIDASASTATHGLYLANNASGGGYRWLSMRNLYIVGSNQVGSLGFAGEALITGSFENIQSREWGNCFDFKKVNRRPSNLTFINCQAIDPVTKGWYMAPECRSFRFITCRAEANTNTPNYAFHFDGGIGSLALQDDHILEGCELEDDWVEAGFYFQNCNGITMTGGGPGTDATGDGIRLENVRHSIFEGVRFRTYDAARHALTLDANTFNCHFIACDIVDPRDWDAIEDSSSGRNNLHFSFSGTTFTPIRNGVGHAANVFNISQTTPIDMREPGCYRGDASGTSPVRFNLGSAAQSYQIGMVFEFRNVGATGETQVNPGTSQTINGSNSLVRLTEQWETLVLRVVALGEWEIVNHYIPSLEGRIEALETP